MYPFSFLKVKDSNAAVAAIAEPFSKFIGGGTNLLDLMKLNIERPVQLIDINNLEFKKVETLANGNLLIGAMVRNSDLAYHPQVTKSFPLLSQAILAGASPQLRNMASTGGNLLQRTRCYYFFDRNMPCNKREPGSGCSAITGYNRAHAILGTSTECVATHPSDMCVAMAALEAIIHLRSGAGSRTIAFADFHLLPGKTPDIENTMKPGELITHVEIPQLPYAHNSVYIKVRDRNSYEFALTSAAVAVGLTGRTIDAVRIALGGVGTKPWRALEAEAFLKGKMATMDNYRSAAEIAFSTATPLKHNLFKVELGKRTIVKALQNTGG